MPVRTKQERTHEDTLRRLDGPTPDCRRVPAEWARTHYSTEGFFLRPETLGKVSHSKIYLVKPAGVLKPRSWSLQLSQESKLFLLRFSFWGARGETQTCVSR